MSRQEAGRGQSVTVTARGYGEGRTLTVWRDANLDGQRDPGERVLCEVVVGSNGTGRCDFSPFVPPFVGGFGECVSGSGPELQLRQWGAGVRRVLDNHRQGTRT